MAHFVPLQIHTDTKIFCEIFTYGNSHQSRRETEKKKKGRNTKAEEADKINQRGGI